MNDMEMIGNVLDLSQDIYLIYLELFRLEVSGSKESARYLSIIKSLKEKISEEKKLYELLAQDRESFHMLLNYIKNKPTQLLFLRMYGYMVFNEIDSSKLEDIDQEEENFRRLYSVCNKDLFLVYLSFLQDYIDSTKSISLRKGLIYTKYYNSYLNLDLEEYLIDKNFEVSKINYASAYFVSKILLMDEKLATDEILASYYDAIVISISRLLSIEDDLHNNEDRMVDIISSECMLRASLSMLSDKEYESSKEKIYRLLNELSTNKNSISVGIINSIIKGRTKDKVRARRIYTGN